MKYLFYIFSPVHKICRWSQLFFIFIFIFSASTIPAQEPAYKLQELFMDAETWFYFQDYKNSLPLYLRVHEAYPENHNINYKIGFCYLHIEGQKQKAIPYLKKASENTTFNYNREAFYEREAPVDALFYLANAYLIDNQLDKALEYYNAFEKEIENKRGLFSRRNNYDRDYLEKQKQACRNAKELMSNPVNFTAQKLGISVNTPLFEFNPVISGDRKTLIFTSERKFYTGIFMVQKKNGQWGPPVNLLPQLGIDGDCETSSLSHDGKELYLYREDELDGNIYVSYFEDGQWSNIKKLGENINTKYWESHATISADGKKLYFVSNREGGIGDLDIYISERLPNGKWGVAKNMGKPINTQWREDTPFLTEDGNTIFFSSEGHYSMGGFDIFVAHKTEEGWSEPQNLGYPINTTDHNRFFVPFNNGNQAYYANINLSAAGGKDIFKYHLKDLSTIDFIDIEGVFTSGSEEQEDEKIKQINVINTETKDTIAKLNPDEQSRSFKYQKIDGKNHLVYKTPVLKNNQQYLISKDFELRKKTAQKMTEEKKEPKTTREKPKPTITLNNKIFKAASEKENIKIKLNLHGGNQLEVTTYQNDKLINSEKFTIEKNEFLYEYQPTGKETKIKFSLVDENNNKQTRDITILPADTAAKTDRKAPELDIAGQSYSLDSTQKKITIKLNVEKNSKLFVSTYIQDKLIDKEEFDVKKDFFTYEFEPREEESKIQFKLIDKNNNIVNKEIIVSNKPINKELKQLLKSINQINSKNIQNKLHSIKQEASAEEFITSFFKDTSDKLSIQKKNLNTFLFANVLYKTENVPEFHDKLIQLSDDSLKIYLKSIHSEKYTSKNNYLKDLIMASQNKSFNMTNIRELLYKYLAEQYTKDELSELMNQFAQMNLPSLFQNLKTKNSDMVSIEDLIKYLQQKDTPRSRAILAYIMAVELSDIKLKAEEKEPSKIKKEKPGDKQGIWWIISIGTVLILLIILLVTRRKRKKIN